MFLALMRQQWQSTKVAALLLLTVCLALPILSMRDAADASGPWAAWELVGAASTWGFTYPLVAMLGALGTAIGVWRPDHRSAHVYALTLPLPRWRYLFMRYSAGLVLLLASGMALAIGAMVAVRAIVLPPGLHAYPLSLALRFCVAGVVAYTLLFALSGLTARVARWLVALLLLIVIASAGFDLLGLSWNPLRFVIDAALSPYSPLVVFRASWMLIDA